MPGAPVWLVIGMLIIVLLPAAVVTLHAAQENLQTTELLLGVQSLIAALYLIATTWIFDPHFEPPLSKPLT